MTRQSTTLKKTNQRLERLNRVLRAIRGVSQLIVQTTDRDTLLQKTCDCLTELNGYCHVWIALMNQDRRLEACCQSGLDDDILPVLESLEAGDPPRCLGEIFTGQAILSVKEPLKDCPDCSLSAYYRGCGAVAVGIMCNGRVYGVLVVSVPKEYVRDPEESTLLTELADDLGFALNKLDNEKRLRETEETLRKSRQIAHVGTWTLDLATGMITWSDEVFRIFGCSPQACKPTYETLIDCVHPEDRERVDDAYSKSIKEKSSGYELEHRIIRRDTGDVRFVHAKCEHVKNRDGEVTRSIGMVQDITERKQREEELQRCNLDIRKSEALLDATGRMAKVGGWELDIQTNDVIWTKETYRIHEVPFNEKPGLDDALHFFHPEDRPILEQAIQEAMNAGRPYDLELRFKTAKGKHLVTRTIGMPVIENDQVVRLNGTFQDVTELKQAEKEVRQSEEKLRVTLSSIGDAVISTDLSGCVAFMNPVAESLTGWKLKEARGQQLETIFPIINETTRGPAFNPVERTLKEGVVVGLANHTLLLSRDGREIPIADSCAPIIDDAGQITGAVLVFRDQTQERAYKNALESNYQLLKIAGETSKFGGWTVDFEKDIGTWSDVVAEIHDMPRGYAPSIQEGINFYAPEYRQRITDVFNACAEKGVPYDEELQIISRKGRRVWTRTCGRAVKNDEGKIIGVEGSFQDISDKKRMETALRESEKKFRSMFENAPTGMALVDLNFKFVEANEAYCVFTGYEEAELRDLSLADITHPDDLPENMRLQRQLGRGEISKFTMEKRFLCKGGDVKWGIMTSCLLTGPDESPVGFLGHVVDVTEEKKMRQQLNHKERLDAIGQLAGGVAHDFNNQLSGVLGYGDMLVKRLDDPTLRRYAENICKSARRSADLTLKLLAFARKGQFQSAPVDMHNVIREAVEILSHSLDKRIQILMDLKAPETTVVGDPAQFESLLLNLAFNARDAMPDGGTLAISTDVMEFDTRSSPAPDLETGRYMVISVSDSGCGIPEHIQPRIFEPFFTTKEVGKGTGMGLASVYGTVDYYKGHIAVESAVEKGTSVTVYLPLDSHTSGDQSGRLSKTGVPGQIRILVVDDEEMIRDLAVDILSNAGYTVVTAVDGQQAVEVYQKTWKDINLVILDVVMPKMDGQNTFRQMKKINPDVRAVLVSGYNLNDKVKAILAEGAFAFVQKPFEKARLLHAIKQAILAEVEKTTPPDRIRDG